MTTLKGTETQKNLLKAFSGEAQARNRYNYFASVAKKEGYEAIGMIFDETANQELAHAKRLFKFFDEIEPLEITYTYPAGAIGTTIENLAEAINGEHDESTIMYPSFAEVAKAEGFPIIAAAMENIAKAEEYHEKRYEKLLGDINTNRLLEKSDKILWKCQKCGFHITSKSAPKVCPACGHPQGYFIEVSDILF